MKNQRKICNRKIDFLKLKFVLSFCFMASALISLAQVPIADFTSNRNAGCGPLSISFRDASTNEPKFWNWDFGNGQLSNQQNPTVTYSQPGTYSVTLVVRNADGTNGITKTDYITVEESPRASFTVSSTRGCIPSEIHFTSTSTSSSGSIVGWQWNFGDGNTSTEANPTHTYSEPGFYTVSLRVTSSSGCENAVTRVRLIRIVSGVVADFTESQPETCQPPFVVNFRNQTSGPGTIQYQWDLADAGTSTEVSVNGIYNAAGDYTIRLIATSDFGCADTVARPITVRTIRTEFTGDDSACIGSTLNFQNNSGQTPLATAWYLDGVLVGNEAQFNRRFPTEGSYELKMVNRYEYCSDSAVRSIHILPQPVADFSSSPVSACAAPLEVSFTNLTPNTASATWDFGDNQMSSLTNPRHVYQTAGNYTVRLIIQDRFGCIDTVTRQNTVAIVPPLARITNANAGGCAPFAYTPVHNVRAIDGVRSWFWDFGDGRTSTAERPTVVYNTVGNYNLKLRIITNGGCEDSLTVRNAISVGEPGIVDFSVSVDTSCAQASVSFSDLSTNIDRWLWRFGDGDSSIAQNPTHQYQLSGDFSVSLTGYNNGCPVTVTKTDIIHITPPVARFDYEIDCDEIGLVRFRGRSEIDLTKTPLAYRWFFGDENNIQSTDRDVNFRYSSPGVYRARLEVTNGGCVSSIEQDIAVPQLSADFTLSKDTICRNEPFVLTAVNSDAGRIETYRWQIGNEVIEGGRQLRRTRNTVGVYNIRLTVTDSIGCTTTRMVPNMLRIIGPTASFTPEESDGCVNTQLVFTDASSPAQNIVSWTFDFGDGTTQRYTQGPFEHRYTDTGAFTVRLTVEDTAGCTHSQTRNNAIYIGGPKANFLQDSVLHCPGAPLLFEDSSSGNGLSYRWDFGDGNMSTERNPVHTYTGDDNIYSVRLSITDSLGCSDELIRENYITILAPKPAFTVSDTVSICPPFETLFTSAARDYESFYWDFGDSTEISFAENPRHFYNDYQNFTAKLYTIGFGGCIDSAHQTIQVVNPNITRVNYTAPVTCNELEVDFDIQPPAGTAFIFSFGDGSSDSSQSRSLRHLYASPATYNPSILITDAGGCQARIGAGSAIRVIGAQPLFGIDNDEFCDSGRVYFTNYTLGNDPIVEYRWDFGDGTQRSGEDDQVHQYTQPGLLVPRLTVRTERGCTDFITDTIMIYSTPNVSISSPDTVCVNSSVILSAELIRPDTISVNYAWNFGNGGSSASREPNTSFASPGDYQLRIDTRLAFGCNATASRNIHVVPLPTAEPAGSPVIFSGGSADLLMNYTGPIVSYNWSPGLGLSCTQCAQPLANPRYTTTYKVQVIDRHGCENTGETTVTVVCGTQNFFIPNTFSPNGDGRNDYFYPRGTGLDQIRSLKIFNRWGEQIFERINFPANQATAGWDGRVKGKPAASDVYIYTIELVCDNGQIFAHSGNIMLIR